MRFSEKVVIVTGAGSGIGAACVKRFASEGASIVLAGRREAKLREVAGGIPDERVLVHQADVGDEASVASLLSAAIERFGRLDVLVNNAGTGDLGPTAHARTERWREIMATNVDGVFFASRGAIPYLIESKGSIVNVSSVSGLGGDWMMSMYNASKGAVTNFTRSLALELGRFGVRVNAVNPSLTMTEMTEALTEHPELVAKFEERIPLGRAAHPDEVASVIAFLASDDARFVSGVNLPVDGGLGASNGQPRIA